MRIIGVIPARYASSRFPGKPLATICGKPMIQWVFENVKKSEQISQVYVATDDERIYNAVKRFSGNALMTSPHHRCGTDRIAECIHLLNLNPEDIVLNIQGDEPLVKPKMINDLIDCFSDPKVYMATLKKKIEKDDELCNPNVVKVITDIHNDALYFSRCCIPYDRDKKGIAYYKHIGMYGYTSDFLLQYTRLYPTPLESVESLEQLRVLENGYKIRVKETQYQTIGVDTPEQIKQVESILRQSL